MTITVWKTSWGPYRKDARIEPVECLKRTAHGYTVREQTPAGERECWVKPRGAWDQYHDTWEQAHAYLLDAASDDVAQARRRLEQARAVQGNVKGLKKPEAQEA